MKGERKLNIAEVVSHMSCGGVSRFLTDLCRELAKTDEVTLVVIMSPKDGGAPLEGFSPEVRVVELGLDCSSFFKALCAIPRVCWELLRLKPDVVHCHLEAFRAVIPLILFNFRRIPFLYTIHNDPVWDAGRYLKLHGLLFRLPRVYPITISPDAQKSFFRKFHRRAQLIINGYGGQEPSRDEICRVRPEFQQWKTTPASLVLLNLARISEQKNQVALANAVKRLADQGLEIDLVIMGPEDSDGMITGRIRDIDCKRIHLVGMRTNPLPYLAQADALVLPSLYEGLPIALLEAFLTGVPCCVTAVGGMKDLVRHNGNGLVCRGTGADDIMEMLRSFCALSAEIRREMGRCARESFAAYSMKNCAASYRRLMCHVNGE